MNIFQKFKLKKQLKAYICRPLDIHEILSRQSDDNVVIDAYEFYMRKCDWDCSKIDNEIIRNFLLCIQFCGEVANGGISQFLSNSSGDMTYETLKALNTIGIFDAVKFLNKAMSFFSEGNVPKNREERNSIMDRFGEDIEAEFDSIDSSVWAIDIYTPCLDYLRNNKQFFTDNDIL